MQHFNRTQCLTKSGSAAGVIRPSGAGKSTLARAITGVWRPPGDEIRLDGASLDRLERMDIRAPASGIVYGLTVFTPRSVIRAAEPVMYLIPQDHPLIIAAQVSPLNIDELFVFQDVTYAFQHWISARHPNCSVRL